VDLVRLLVLLGQTQAPADLLMRHARPERTALLACEEVIEASLDLRIGQEAPEFLVHRILGSVTMLGGRHKLTVPLIAT
jgi:hypothetical protein